MPKSRQTSRNPRVGEFWITNSGQIVQFVANIGGVLAAVLTKKGRGRRGYKVSGTYNIDWTWYSRSGTWDHPSNPSHALDAYQFLSR